TLTPAGARMFRLLGLHDGPDVSVAAAASLSGLPVRRTRPLLSELARAHLIVEHVPARFTFHDLLRAYATELADTTDTSEQRAAAVRRVLDHYLHTAHHAARLLSPQRDPLPLTEPAHGTTVEHLADHHVALAWFTAEHAPLLTVVRQAAAQGLDHHVWWLAWSSHTYFNRQGHWHDWAAVWQLAVEATARLADPVTQAAAHRCLAWPHLQLGHSAEAFEHLRLALELDDDPVNRADIHLDLGRILTQQDRNAEALDHACQALGLYRSVNHRSGLAFALNNIGMASVDLGDHRRALECCREALALQQELGNQDGEAGAWDSLGYAYHHLGDHAEASDSYQRALELYRDLGDRYEVAATLGNLGDTRHAAGQADAAREAWREALAILEDLAHPDADRLRAKLHADGRPQ
ncbi:MAG: hypothetical protein QOF58_6055, partial [Pseudonocardiales bacterium]|nr:hypothetical protein [Pseudonocardiales bacterium]